ncbi:MAG: GDSL-type esterase/lipase family protein [Prevotella sp.]|jgi:lysophospholipase L1-like esterase|nr:GDSL-type esterase/lipase family protein [Prevotella sp.]
MTKKKFFITVFILSLILNIVCVGYIGIDYYKNKRNRSFFELNAYAWANSQLKAPEQGENRVVFIGNSITENWVHLNYRFFKDNGYVCRGIGGQTSPLILLRFQHDVVDLRPKIVVINAGINDIGENTGEYNIDFTVNNIKSMCQLAKANGIGVVLTSLLPCSGYGFKGHITNVPQKVDELNDCLRTYAMENIIYFLDYNTPMRDAKGGMKSELTFDGLHPNEEGYKVMEPLVQKAIDDVLNQNDEL